MLSIFIFDFATIILQTSISVCHFKSKIEVRSNIIQMLPGISLHLIEVKRKDKELGFSLAPYIAFMHQASEILIYMSEYIQGVGKAGPPYQTVKHNIAFLARHFPELPKELAEVINFLFRMPAVCSTSNCAS